MATFGPRATFGQMWFTLKYIIKNILSQTDQYQRILFIDK